MADAITTDRANAPAVNPANLRRSGVTAFVERPIWPCRVSASVSDIIELRVMGGLLCVTDFGFRLQCAVGPLGNVDAETFVPSALAKQYRPHVIA
jgi:hypothetical protein